MFNKDYKGTFTGEVFEVYKRFRKYPRFHINLDKVKDLSGELIEGSYTQKELQKVELPSSPRLGEVIKRKGKQKFKQLSDYPEGTGVWVKKLVQIKVMKGKVLMTIFLFVYFLTIKMWFKQTTMIQSSLITAKFGTTKRFVGDGS